jgi:ADYC domain
MQKIQGTWTVLVSAALLGGCSDERASEEIVARASSPVIDDNGIHVNGIHVNGIHVNGIHVNGLQANGTAINGLYVAGMSLKGTVLSGTVNGVPVSGAGFIGATMKASTLEGSDLQLHIDDVQASGDPDITLYSVSVLAPGGSVWSPLCVDTGGNAVAALPLSGDWDEGQGTPTAGKHLDDPTQFTFACQGYALAKCAEMGYKPWKATQECLSPGVCHPVPLGYLHQACTRMMRADYCGDGTPSTRNGTLIDVGDMLNMETPSAPPGWIFEAEWGVSGATCVTATRWPTLPADGVDPGESVIQYIADHCPERWAGKGSTCGTSASTLFTQNGYALPLAARSLLSTRITGP